MHGLFGVVLLFALFASAGCRAKSGASGSASARAKASASAVPASTGERCREVKGAVVTLGEAPKAKAKAAEGEEEEPDDSTLPFAPHVGDAVVLAGHFAVGGQRPGAGGTEDVVALLADDGRSGRVISLGRVYGDVDPPTIAARGAELVLAVPDADAKGGTLRLFSLAVTGDRPRALGEVMDVEHDAGVALAFGPDRALVVWGAERSGRTTLRAAWVRPMEPASQPSSHEIEGTLDAEAPVLLLRPGGYWLAWVAERDVPDAGRSEADAGRPDQDQKLVDVGPRILHALLLDRAGKPTGRPLSVSGESAHVVGFDAAAQADGSLDVVWREDDTTPGVDRGDLQTARVGPDGSVKSGRVDDQDLGGGVPALLSDPSVPGRTWLVARSARDAARIGVLASGGVSVEGLSTDAALGSADLLAAGAGRLLVSRYRERALELSLVSCRP